MDQPTDPTLLQADVQTYILNMLEIALGKRQMRSLHFPQKGKQWLKNILLIPNTRQRQR